MTLTIRPAEDDHEFEIAMALLMQRIQWLRERGSDQWVTWERWRTKLGPSLAAGDIWILWDGDEAIGTITVEMTGDSDFWTPDELAEPAVYVSKLAVRLDRAGQELGTLLLAWASDYAWRHGCRYVRLDAWKTNERLHAYYLSRGWTYLRTSADPRRRSGALFQRSAGPMSQQPIELRTATSRHG
ncbi:GNAT family N-acetyltransferase [Micromonospora sp. C31]|uniref:GNAT family N-acetyltransferase n=1 Tax=Micromonospora sp. C31 TaxID=2824876 RepID=UPI001B378F57|nr:GNAT family N-acetyltransferase [Micromonospora sp. C31]MBQ1076421.1 GNAT family N-acetyltransferase [Micromonospora sp. C31]